MQSLCSAPDVFEDTFGLSTANGPLPANLAPRNRPIPKQPIPTNLLVTSSSRSFCRSVSDSRTPNEVCRGSDDGHGRRSWHFALLRTYASAYDTLRLLRIAEVYVVTIPNTLAGCFVA
jgi:hypothetical protein